MAEQPPSFQQLLPWQPPPYRDPTGSLSTTRQSHGVMQYIRSMPSCFASDECVLYGPGASYGDVEVLYKLSSPSSRSLPQHCYGNHLAVIKAVKRACSCVFACIWLLSVPIPGRACLQFEFSAKRAKKLSISDQAHDIDLVATHPSTSSIHPLWTTGERNFGNKPAKKTVSTVNGTRLAPKPHFSRGHSSPVHASVAPQTRKHHVLNSRADIPALSLTQAFMPLIG
jgi:hypothetical protein